MKKITAFLLSAAAGAMLLTGCSDTEGDVSSVADTEKNESSSVVVTVTSKAPEKPESRAETMSSERDTIKDDAESMVDKAESKADEITDDLADGIGDGLDTAESIVDDILR